VTGAPLWPCEIRELKCDRRVLERIAAQIRQAAVVLKVRMS